MYPKTVEDYPIFCFWSDVEVEITISVMNVFELVAAIVFLMISPVPRRFVRRFCLLMSSHAQRSVGDDVYLCHGLISDLQKHSSCKVLSVQDEAIILLRSRRN